MGNCMKLTVENDSGLFDSEATLNAISISLLNAKEDGVVKVEYIVNTGEFGFSEREEAMVTAACLWILQVLKGRGYWGFVQEGRKHIRVFALFCSEAEYNKFWHRPIWKGLSDSRTNNLWNPELDTAKWTGFNGRQSFWDPKFLDNYPVRHTDPYDPPLHGLLNYTRGEMYEETKSLDIRFKSDFAPYLQTDRFFYGNWGGKSEIPHSRSIPAKQELRKFVEIHLSNVPPVYGRQIANELLDGVDGKVWDEVDKDENVKVEASIKWADDNGQSKITLVVDLLKISPKAVDGISI